MKRPTFRLKIALLSAIISGAVMVAFGWAALAIVTQQKIDGLDTRLRSLGSRQPGWLAQRRDYPRFEEVLEFVFGGDGHDPAILLVLDAKGGLAYRSAGWPEELDPADFKRPLRDDPEAVAEAASGADADGFGRKGPGGGLGLGPGGGKPVRYTKIPEFQTAQTRDGRWRIGRLGTDDTTLVIGLNFKAAEAEIAHVRRLFLLALPVALAVVALGGWIVAGRALRPLRVIADTAARVTSRGLDQRIPLSGEDPEIDRLSTMLNLLTNAVKYNEPGGLIRVSAELAGDEVVLQIGNSGSGIPADDQPRIFSRFHRAERGLGHRVDGIGLGLSLTREILHAHRATVELKESRQGWTLFEVRMASWKSPINSKP